VRVAGLFTVESLSPHRVVPADEDALLGDGGAGAAGGLSYGGGSPELMIDDEWLDEWLRLPRGEPGWRSFPEFIDVKVKNHGSETLFAGLSLMERRHDDYMEPGSGIGWYRKFSD